MTTVPQGALFRARTRTPGRAGRKTSRTGLRNMATLKPPSPLLAPNKGPLKPPSPLRPKTAPKTSISHSQRRWRFQLAHLTGPQRRQGFQTTEPPGLQGQAAVPAGPEAMSSPAISHLDPSNPHVNPMTCAWATPPTCRARGRRAYHGVNVHVQRFACEQHTEIDTESAKVQTHSAKTAYF